MRLLSAAPRADHATRPVRPRTLRRRLAGLLTLALLGAPALSAGSALADDAAAPVADAVAAAAAADAAEAEGVVTLKDVRRPATTDAAVRPAGLLHGAGCVDVCDAVPGCDAPAAPTCGPACAPGCDGACDGACLPGHACGLGGCLFGGHGLGGHGLGGHGLGGHGHGCPPGRPCPPGHPCPPGLACPGACPGACLLGGGLPLPCPACLIPGLLPGGCLPHALHRDGEPCSCYLCSLSGIGANANNGRKGLLGSYEHVYALDPSYVDRRTGNVWASQQTGVPMAVPLAPNVRHTMEYGWGMPSSRLVPISRPGPPSWLYGPPAGVQVELPATKPTYGRNLPTLPEHGQGGLPRTGVAFPRTLDNAGNR